MTVEVGFEHREMKLIHSTEDSNCIEMGNDSNCRSKQRQESVDAAVIAEVVGAQMDLKRRLDWELKVRLVVQRLVYLRFVAMVIAVWVMVGVLWRCQRHCSLYCANPWQRGRDNLSRQ